MGVFAVCTGVLRAAHACVGRCTMVLWDGVAGARRNLSGLVYHGHNGWILSLAPLATSHCMNADTAHKLPRRGFAACCRNVLALDGQSRAWRRVNYGATVAVLCRRGSCPCKSNQRCCPCTIAADDEPSSPARREGEETIRARWSSLAVVRFVDADSDVIGCIATPLLLLFSQPCRCLFVRAVTPSSSIAEARGWPLFLFTQHSRSFVHNLLTAFFSRLEYLPCDRFRQWLADRMRRT